LHDTGNFPFSEAAQLTIEEEREKAQEYFENWYPRGETLLKGASFYLHLMPLLSSLILL